MTYSSSSQTLPSLDGDTVVVPLGRFSVRGLTVCFYFIFFLGTQPPPPLGKFAFHSPAVCLLAFHTR